MESQPELFAAVRYVRKFLLIAGHWPDRPVSYSSEFRSFLSFISSTAFFVTNLIEIILHFSDFKDLAENMSVTAPVISFIVKLVVFKLKKQTFFQMLDMVMTAKTFEPRSDSHRASVKSMGGKCILVMKIYGGICTVVVILYALVSLTNESKLPIKFTYDFGSWIYGMYVFQMTAIMNTALNTVCLDMLAICFIGMVISQLEALQMALQDLSRFSPEEKGRLDFCIVHHSEIIKFLGFVEDIFNQFFLSQYFCSIFSICNIGFQLANIQPLSAQFANMVFYFSAMMFQLAAFCWFGNEIVLKSVAVGDACYEAHWLQFEDKIKKSLIIVMTRANRPLAVTAGKFSILSLRSLTAIINASYSYFALMQRLYKKE